MEREHNEAGPSGTEWWNCFHSIREGFKPIIPMSFLHDFKKRMIRILITCLICIFRSIGASNPKLRIAHPLPFFNIIYYSNTLAVATLLLSKDQFVSLTTSIRMQGLSNSEAN